MPLLPAQEMLDLLHAPTGVPVFQNNQDVQRQQLKQKQMFELLNQKQVNPAVNDDLHLQ